MGTLYHHAWHTWHSFNWKEPGSQGPSSRPGCRIWRKCSVRTILPQHIYHPRRHKLRIFHRALALGWGKTSRLQRIAVLKPSPRAAPQQPQKRHAGGWTRGRPWFYPSYLTSSAELSVAGRHSGDMSTGHWAPLCMKQAQAHNAPIMSVPHCDRPATCLLALPMTHRVRKEELNTAREQNNAENTRCFLGHRKFALALAKAVAKLQWRSQAVATPLATLLKTAKLVVPLFLTRNAFIKMRNQCIFCIHIKRETFQTRTAAIDSAPGARQMSAEKVHQPNELR